MTVSPAYGRDYSSKAAVLQDWNDGKDFSVNGGGGPYINLEDAKHEGMKSVNIRYAKLTKVVVVAVK